MKCSEASIQGDDLTHAIMWGASAQAVQSEMIGERHGKKERERKRTRGEER